MGIAASVLRQAASEAEVTGARAGAAVPAHWRGPAAGGYQQQAAELGADLAGLAAMVRSAADQALAHENEMARTASALGGGGPV